MIADVRRLALFAGAGVLTGAAAAALCSSLRFGEPAAIEIAGYCIGIKPGSYSHCGTVDSAFYLFPGLMFGIVFGPLLRVYRELRAAAAAGYAAAAMLANAAAVFVCVSLQHPFDDVLPNPIVDMAIAGAIAGALGSFLLGITQARLAAVPLRLLAVGVGAGLGVLTPIMLMYESPGAFAFYIIWQAGYAAAVARSSRVGAVPVTSPTSRSAPWRSRSAASR